MRHVNGSKWHMCQRWLEVGLACPFAAEGEEDTEEGEPPDDIPPIGVPVGGPPALLLAARRARVGDVLAQAEEIVARAAEAIPVAVGNEVESLANRLRVPGAISVGAGVAAGFAVRQVAKRLAQRAGFSGGFNFPSVLDPAKAFRRP